MKLAIMQPYLFPYIGYFQLVNAVDKFVLLDDVNYINKGWINRNRILTNGSEYTFTIPLKDVSQNKLIQDVEIADDTKWKGKFLKTLEMSYKKAPFADSILPMVSEVINPDVRKITTMIKHSLDLILKYLQIKTEIIASSSVYNITDLKAQERIREICKKENASQYINLIGGKELYSQEYFSSVGIKLNFLRSSLDVYQHAAPSFVPGLSIIDVLMNNPPERIKEFLLNYTLE